MFRLYYIWLGRLNRKHLAMMEFRRRIRKQEECIQVFAFKLEVLLRRAVPN